MAWDGRGKLIDRDRIWAGELETGAVIQTWTTHNDFLSVKNGETPQGEGHSFIFIRYVWSGNSPVGMKVADQGTHKDKTVTCGDWGYWVGCNIRCLGADPDPLRARPVLARRDLASARDPRLCRGYFQFPRGRRHDDGRFQKELSSRGV